MSHFHPVPCTLCQCRLQLLRSLSSVPATFLATCRHRDSSMCFVRIGSLLAHLLFSQELLLCFGVLVETFKSSKASTIRVRIRNHQSRPQHCSTRSGTPLSRWCCCSIPVNVDHSRFLALQLTRAQSTKVSGASECEEHSTQGPTTILIHQCEHQRDQHLPCFSPHRVLQPPATLDGLQPLP